MPAFVQLSKHQKKFWAHFIPMASRMNEHAKLHPSKEDKARAQAAIEAEIKHLAEQQAIDKLNQERSEVMRNAPATEDVRVAMAREAQTQLKGVKIRRAKADANA